MLLGTTAMTIEAGYTGFIVGTDTNGNVAVWYATGAMVLPNGRTICIVDGADYVVVV